MNRQRIIEYLEGNGFKFSTTGFHYLVDAILLAAETTPWFVMKEIYIKMQQKYSTTPSRIERCIRYAIQRAGRNENVKEFIAKAIYEVSCHD